MKGILFIKGFPDPNLSYMIVQDQLSAYLTDTPIFFALSWSDQLDVFNCISLSETTILLWFFVNIKTLSRCYLTKIWTAVGRVFSVYITFERQSTSDSLSSNLMTYIINER
jgi:hypothetical protein